MTSESIAISSLTFINGLLLAGIIYFVKKLVDKLEKNSGSIVDLSTKIQLMDKDVKSLVNATNGIQQINEDVVILKRDQKTMWNKYDELYKTSAGLRDRSHSLANHIAVIFAKLKIDRDIDLPKIRTESDE